jgi:hypothetical protein
MRYIKLGGGLLASLAILSGCGSSNSTLSYSAFSNAADKICSSTTSEVGALNLNSDQQASPSAASALSKALADGNAAISKLKALKGPSALESTLGTFVGNYQQQAAAIQSMISAAKSSDQSGYVSAGQTLSSLEQQGNADGSQLGAASCAK